MAEKWSSATTFKFLRELRSHKCLWNIKSPLHKSKKTRQLALLKIVRSMNIEGFGVPEAKTKIRNLRSTYYQEKKKIKNSINSGGNPDNIYTPALKWFGEMDALLAKDADGGETTFNSETIEDPALLYTNDVDSEPDQIASESFNHGEEPDRKDSSRKRSQNSTENDAQSAKNDSSEIQDDCCHFSNISEVFRAVAELKKLHETINNEQQAMNLNLENQFDAFGKSVAAQLKALPFELALSAQSRIQNLLSDLAIENYRANVSRTNEILNEATDADYMARVCIRRDQDTFYDMEEPKPNIPELHQ